MSISHNSLPSPATTLQHYFVDITGLALASPLSVHSFELHEGLAQLYRASITLTHPQAIERSEVLNHPACFRMVPMVGEEQRFAGWVSAFSQLQHSADQYRYRIVIEPQAARLRLTPACRIFQHQSAPAIIEAILRRHDFQGHQFAFRLRRDYVEHAFRLQYQLDDWAYVQLLMQQEGLYSLIETSEHGDVLVFADDIDHYVYQPALQLPYRESAGLNPNSDAILALETHSQTIPATVQVADYNPDAAWERLQAESHLASKDHTTYGQPYIYGSGHRDPDQAQWQAQLRHEVALAAQVRHTGLSTSMQARPGRVIHADQPVPDSPHGIVITEVIHHGARDEAYRNQWTAIPADRRFRLPLDEAQWPRIAGTLSARVTSPDHYKYAYVTEQGYYVVRFDLDFDPWNPGGESVPLRLAKPFAGKLQTGMHFPALDGDEAVIAFRDGDPNKPYISAFQHNSVASDLITNQDRWMSRNVIRTQSDNKLQMEDWQGQEHVKLSTEHSGKSQLQLGHIVDGQRTRRGEGFELRSSAHGAIRAGKGVLVSSHDRPQAQGSQLDMQETLQQLGQAQAQIEALAAAATAAQADAADAKAMNQVLQQQLKDLQQAVILLSSPSSIALSAADSIQHGAGKDLSLSAGRNADIGTLRKFTVAAGDAISLFAQKAGIKLFAGRGKVQIQAQNDELLASALKDVTISSIDGKLILTAAREVWIGAGGSYIRINAERIENGTPGDILEKCAYWGKQAPQFQSLASNQAKHTAFNEGFQARFFNGEIARHRDYVLTRADGGQIHGTTDANGIVPLQQGLNVEGMSIHFPEPKSRETT